MENTANTDMIPIIAKNFADLMNDQQIHQHIPNLINKLMEIDEKEALHKMMQFIRIKLTFGGHDVAKFMKVKGFISSLFKVFKNSVLSMMKPRNVMDGRHNGRHNGRHHGRHHGMHHGMPSYSVPLMRDVKDIVKFICGQGYNSYFRQITYDEKLFDELDGICSDNSGLDTVMEILVQWVKFADNEDVDKLLEHNIIDKFTKSQEFSWCGFRVDLAVGLLKNCSKSQRLNVVDLMIIDPDMMNQQIENRMMKLANYLNDVNLEKKLLEIKNGIGLGRERN